MTAVPDAQQPLAPSNSPFERPGLRDPDVLRRALEASAIPTALVSAAGMFLWLNRAQCELFGRTEAELMVATWQELTFPDDLEIDLSLVADVLDGVRESYRLRKRYVRKDGAVVWGDLTVSCVRDDAGEFICFLSQVVDLTAEIEAENALRESQERLAEALEAELEARVILEAVRSDDGDIIDMTYVEANPAACRAIGLARDQIVGHRLLELFPEVVHTGRLAEYSAVAESGQPIDWSAQPVNIQRLGGERYLDAHIVKVGDGVSYSYRDVTDRVIAEREREHLARFDALTGLLNRAQGLELVSRLTSHEGRSGALVAVLFCDVDRFKYVNDEYGHAAGDLVLRTIAERIQLGIRADDHAARIGGDELLVVLGGVHALDDAIAIAQKLRVAAAERIAIGAGIEVTTTMSIGVALARPGEATDALIERADAAMYQAKKSGRDHVIAIP